MAALGSRLSVWAVVALAAIALAVAAARAAGEAKTHTVAMEGTQFLQPQLKVRAGDTVVWVNRDPFPHTATSKAGRFDSKVLQPEASWKFLARENGTFPYVCTLHPTMRGVLTVE